jgi:demethylphylloquinol methyltransferase
MASFRPGDPEAVQELFEQIAPRYDQLNDLLSFGLHRLWKRQAIAWLHPQPGQHLLDLCCGTGDLALVLASRLRPGGSVLGIDAAAAPLAVGGRQDATWPPVWRALVAMGP